MNRGKGHVSCNRIEEEVYPVAEHAEIFTQL